MSEVNKMIKDITDFSELQKFANAQYTVMITQTKKIEALQKEIATLTVQLEQTKQEVFTKSILDTSKDQTNDAETICLIQLALLNRKSMEGELTLEETKKVETFSKVLQLIKGKDSEDNKNREAVKEIDTSNLLSLLASPKATESK